MGLVGGHHAGREFDVGREGHSRLAGPQRGRAAVSRHRVPASSETRDGGLTVGVAVEPASRPVVATRRGEGGRL